MKSGATMKVNIGMSVQYAMKKKETADHSFAWIVDKKQQKRKPAPSMKNALFVDLQKQQWKFR